MRKYYGSVILIIVMIIGLAGSAFAQSREDEARKHLVRGMAAIEMAKSDEELAAAAEEFKKATEIAPNLAAAWYNLGSVQTKTGQTREAIASYQRYLALAPAADDARRVKDEIIKLEYRLERTEKFKSLSGVWVEPAGGGYEVKAGGSKITIQGYHQRSTDDYSLTAFVGPISVGLLKTLPHEKLSINLSLKGKALSGFWEAPSWSTPYTDPCVIPAEKGDVEGTYDENAGRMSLRLMRSTYKVVAYEPALFGDKSCREMKVSEQRPVEMVFLGPLLSGGIGCEVAATSTGLSVKQPIKGSPAERAGLQAGDEITAIDGADLSRGQSFGEKIMKLRGQPGSTAQLTVQRKKEQLSFSVQRVEFIQRK